MNIARFDSVVQSFLNDWEFESALEFYKKHAVKNKKQLEFCIFLADLGLLDNLHEFIVSNGLYNLKALANDQANTYANCGNARIIFHIYETEMLAIFERQRTALAGIDGDLLSFALYKDNTILESYISKNREIIFKNDQHPKTLTYLTYAFNKLLQRTSGNSIGKLVLNNFYNLKNLTPLRRAYITKKVALNLLTCESTITFPQGGYSELHKLFGIISAQKARYPGAARLYNLISDIIRPELKKPAITQKLGWDSKPKVAVCLSGMYRCGNLALETIYNNIIEPLEADVFFHSWTEMQDWPGLGGAGDEWLMRVFDKTISNKCPPPLRSKKYFKTKFPKTHTLLDTPSQSSFNLTKLPPEIEFTKTLFEDATVAFQKKGIDLTKYSSMGSPNQAKMLYGIYKAHELAVNHEKEKGFRYDYIIRCRPDVALQNKLNFSIMEKLKTNEVAMDFTMEYGPQDQFWYGQRASALAMASLWAASIDSNSLSPFPQLPQMRAHGLIFGWMTDNHLQPVNTPIKRDMKVVTSKATPPDFSAALAEDFNNQAKELSQNQEVLDFFAALQGFNKQ